MNVTLCITWTTDNYECTNYSVCAGTWFYELYESLRMYAFISVLNIKFDRWFIINYCGWKISLNS